jgi:hypothetical protein
MESEKHSWLYIKVLSTNFHAWTKEEYVSDYKASVTSQNKISTEY